MIDCSKTQNYFAEKQRMTKRQKSGLCKLSCTYCPLNITNNDIGVLCYNLEAFYSEQAIEIVQEWSDAHPRKTYLTELLKIFPNTPLNDDGTPKGICLHELGATSLDNCEVDNACAKCWNQPISTEDDEEIK